MPPVPRWLIGPTLAATLALAAPAVIVGLREGDDAGAQAPGPPVTRVVFAIDNSGSMFGVGGEPASDPDQQRIEGVRNLIEVLQGFLGASGEERVVEFAALSFGGGEPQVLSGIENVLGGRLADRLQAKQEQGGTDFRAALCGAWTLATREAPPRGADCEEMSPTFLSAARSGSGQTPGDADARLLVVLITDGSPAPAGSDLAFDGQPPAPECPDDFAGYDSGDGDMYLCSLAETWRALREERTAELAVIGLDEPGQWFRQAEAYWQRVVQCGGAGQSDCTNRVVRSVNPGELAEWILRAFPGVDLCDAIRGETFSCDVPGGLVSVRFQIVGLAADSVSTVLSPDRVSYNSTSDPAELTRLGEATHVWRFERPGAGVWALTAAVEPGRDARVIVDPEPARFDITVEQWNDRGMTLGLALHPTSVGRVAHGSLLTQPYRVELLRGGSTVGAETARLEHAGGETFTLTTTAFGPPAGGSATHEVALYLRTLLAGRVGVASVPPDDGERNDEADREGNEEQDGQGDDETDSDEPLPPPPPVACSAEWPGEPGTAPRWRPAVRLGFPLPVRFRDSATWSVRVGPAECAYDIQATADIPGCDTCSASGDGPAPLALDVATDGLPDGPVERRVTWYVPASGVEDAHTEEVRLADSVFLSTEPYWATALHLLALALLLTAISAVAVRSPRQWRPGEEPARPIDLSAPDARYREVGIVRLGVLVWRRVGLDREGGEPGRLLTLRWLCFGPLVVRDTGEGAGERARWLGTHVYEMTASEAAGLDLRRSPQRRLSS